MSLKFLTEDQVTSGSEPLIAEAVLCLERHGLERKNIRRVMIDAAVGEPIMVTVELFVESEATP